MPIPPLQFTRTDMTSQDTTSVRDLQTDGRDESVPEGCTRIRLSEWEYIPWNNSANIMSQDVQLYTGQVRTNLLVSLYLIGGPANVINMAVFFKQGLRDRVNLLLFSLSLADELCLTVYTTHFFEGFVLQFSGERHFGPYFTILMNNYFVGFHAFCFVSFVLSAIIACERCCCVLWPLRYQTLMRTRTLALIIIAVYVIVLGLFLLVASKYYLVCVYDSDTGATFTVFSHSEFYRRHKELINQLDNILFGIGLPNAVVVVVVTATVITVIKLRKVVAWRTESASSVPATASSVSAKEVALTKMLVGTSILLVICVTPACFPRAASLLVPEINTGRRKENFFFTWIWIEQSFSFVNSSFNIFIYYAMGSRYRETFRALFKRKAERKNWEKLSGQPAVSVCLAASLQIPIKQNS